MVTTLWPVEGEARALLMHRFYQNIQTRSSSCSAALQDAKRWLRDLHGAELTAARKAVLPTYKQSGKMDSANRPFAHPHYWAGYLVVTRAPT